MTETQCQHPTGFLFHAPSGDLRCFDCKEECPGRCVCGAPYRSMQCANNAHLRGARLEVAA